MHRVRVDVIKRPEYIVSYEQWRHLTVVHVHVTRWSHKVAARFREDIDAAQRLLGKSVFGLELPDGSNRKFLLTHGFVQCGMGPTENGETVPVYVRKLPP